MHRSCTMRNALYAVFVNLYFLGRFVSDEHYSDHQVRPRHTHDSSTQHYAQPTSHISHALFLHMGGEGPYARIDVPSLPYSRSRPRWQASAKEVARMKAEFKARVEPKKKAVPLELKSIPTIVIDLGSDTIKVGYAGEDVRGTHTPPAPPVAVLPMRVWLCGWLTPLPLLVCQSPAHTNLSPPITRLICTANTVRRFRAQCSPPMCRSQSEQTENCTRLRGPSTPQPSIHSLGDVP